MRERESSSSRFAMSAVSSTSAASRRSASGKTERSTSGAPGATPGAWALAPAAQRIPMVTAPARPVRITPLVDEADAQVPLPERARRLAGDLLPVGLHHHLGDGLEVDAGGDDPLVQGRVEHASALDGRLGIQRLEAEEGGEGHRRADQRQDVVARLDVASPG